MSKNNQPRAWHLDKNVVLSFLALTAAATGLMGYKLYHYRPCPTVAFEVQEYNPRAGEAIHFTDLTEGNHERVWDFGDSTEATQPDPVHIYGKPGEYMVTLTINDHCMDYRRVVVKHALPLVNRDLVPSFTAPAQVTVGEEVTFNDLTNGATEWEWRFGESGKVDARTRRPTYTFTQPGQAVVSLIVNGNEQYLAEKTIRVLAKPKKRRSKPAPPSNAEPYIPESPEEYDSYQDETIVTRPTDDEAEETAKTLSDEDLLVMIKDIAQKRQQPSVLSPYLCLPMNQSVVKANGNMMTFSEFAKKIQGKDLRVRDLYSYRDKNRCIVRIEIRYRTKLF